MPERIRKRIETNFTPEQRRIKQGLNVLLERMYSLTPTILTRPYEKIGAFLDIAGIGLSYNLPVGQVALDNALELLHLPTAVSSEPSSTSSSISALIPTEVPPIDTSSPQGNGLDEYTSSNDIDYDREKQISTSVTVAQCLLLAERSVDAAGVLLANVPLESPFMKDSASTVVSLLLQSTETTQMTSHQKEVVLVNAFNYLVPTLQKRSHNLGGNDLALASQIAIAQQRAGNTEAAKRMLDTLAPYLIVNKIEDGQGLGVAYGAYCRAWEVIHGENEGKDKLRAMAAGFSPVHAESNSIGVIAEQTSVPATISVQEIRGLTELVTYAMNMNMEEEALTWLNQASSSADNVAAYLTPSNYQQSYTPGLMYRKLVDTYIALLPHFSGKEDELKEHIFTHLTRTIDAQIYSLGLEKAEESSIVTYVTAYNAIIRALNTAKELQNTNMETATMEKLQTLVDKYPEKENLQRYVAYLNARIAIDNHQLPQAVTFLATVMKKGRDWIRKNSDTEPNAVMEKLFLAFMQEGKLAQTPEALQPLIESNEQAFLLNKLATVILINIITAIPLADLDTLETFYQQSIALQQTQKSDEEVSLEETEYREVTNNSSYKLIKDNLEKARFIRLLIDGRSEEVFEQISSRVDRTSVGYMSEMVDTMNELLQ